MIFVDVSGECGDGGVAPVVEDGAQDGAVLLAALAGGGGVVIFPIEERTEERRVLREKAADVAVLRAVDPVVVETVVGFGGAGIVAAEKLLEVGTFESGPSEGEGAHFEDFADLEKVGHVLAGKRTDAPAAARDVFDDVFGVEALKGVTGERARNAEAGGGGFFAQEGFLAAEAEANGVSGETRVEIAVGALGGRDGAGGFLRAGWGGAVRTARARGVVFQQALAAKAGEGETDGLGADLVGLGEAGKTKVEGSAGGGGEATTKIVGDVIGERHFL